MPILLPKLPNPRRRNFSGDPEEFRLTLVEHIEELRTRLIRSILILGGSWCIAWWYTKPVYGYLNAMATQAITPVLPKGVTYREAFFMATEGFMLKLHLSFLLGLILCFPLLVLQLWGFIEPALKPSEAEPIKRIVPVSALLFLIGVGFAWMIMPAALQWLATYVMEFPGTDMVQHAGSLVFFTLKILFSFGIAFQLPLVVYILGELELLTAETLIKYWRQSATAIFVLAMIITPSNDPGTMLAMAIPLVFLFMISVYVVRFSQNRKRRRKQELDSELN